MRATYAFTQSARMIQTVEIDGPPAPPTAALTPVDLRDLMSQEWPGARYVLEPIMPRGETTLLGGHGATGKSTLALTWAAHVACGQGWGPFAAVQARAVYVSLEDRPDVVRYRLRRIIEAYELPAETVLAGLRVFDGSGVDATLAVELIQEGQRNLEPTLFMGLLEAAAKGAGLIVVDNASDGYGGNENERRQVRAFLRMLTTIARANDAALLLLAHVDKNTAKFGANNNAYSGSTAWHNTVRSRLALRKDDDDSFTLEHQKAQFSKPAAAVALTLVNGGVLYPMDQRAADAARAKREQDDAEVVMAVLTAALSADQYIPTATQGRNTAAAALRACGLSKALANARVNAALARLVHDGRIVVVVRRADGRERERYGLPNAPSNQRGDELTRIDGIDGKAVDKSARQFPPIPPLPIDEGGGRVVNTPLPPIRGIDGEKAEAAHDQPRDAWLSGADESMRAQFDKMQEQQRSHGPNADGLS